MAGSTAGPFDPNSPNPSPIRAYLWAGGQLHYLPALEIPGLDIVADINESGTIVGSSRTNHGDRATAWFGG